MFSVHGVDRYGKILVRKRLNRAKLLSFMAQLPASRVGMEACSGAHYRARELQKLGHSVGIMAPRFVSPYRKSSKNDDNDAEAICEAVARPNMRFVPVKSAEQQASWPGQTVHIEARCILGIASVILTTPCIRISIHVHLLTPTLVASILKPCIGT